MTNSAHADFTSINIHDSCLDGLTRAGVVAGAIHDTRECGLVTAALPSVRSESTTSLFDALIEKNGVSVLLGAMPLTAHSLGNLGHLSQLASATSMARQTFLVDLRAPDAARNLGQKLQRARGEIDRIMAAHAGADPEVLQRVSQLSWSAQMLRTVKVDIFGKQGPDELRLFLNQFRGCADVKLPKSSLFERPASAGLGRLASFSMAVKSVRSGLGIDLQRSLPSTKLLSIGGALAPFELLLSPIGRSILPSTNELTLLNRVLARLSLTRLFGHSATSSLSSFDFTGCCKAVQSVPLGQREITRAVNLQELARGLEQTRNGLGIDLSHSGAAPNLVRVVDSFRANHEVAVNSLSLPTQTTSELSRLAQFGTAIQQAERLGVLGIR